MGSQVEPARRLLVPWNTPPSHLELVLNITQGVYIVALPFTSISILRQKKNYENSNISPCKNIIFN